MSCKDKYSLDYFDLNLVFLKSLNKVLSPILTDLFNLCLQKQIFPKCLKIAKVIPIWKDGPRNDPSNFRPISLLPSISKMFERILHSRIISFIEKDDILSNNQFGFRGKRSTVQAVISLIEDIKLNYYNESLVTKCTFLDLKSF